MADMTAALAVVAFAYLAVEWASFAGLRPLAQRLGVEVGRFHTSSKALVTIETDVPVGMVVSRAGPDRWLFRPVLEWEGRRMGRYGPFGLCLGELTRGEGDAMVALRAPIGFALFFGLVALAMLLRMDRGDSLLEWIQLSLIAFLGPTVLWLASRGSALDFARVSGLIDQHK